MSVKMQQMPMMWCRILFFNIIQPTDNLKMSSISEHGSFGWQSICLLYTSIADQYSKEKGGKWKIEFETTADRPSYCLLYTSRDDLKEGELTIPLPEGCIDGEVKVNIVKIVDGTLETIHEERKLPVKNGALILEDDLMYCAVVDLSLIHI